MRHRELLSATGILALLGLFVVADARALRAQDFEKRTWRLTVEGKLSRLEYGTGNVEDTPIAFTCTPGAGLVDVWINETSNGGGSRRPATSIKRGRCYHEDSAKDQSRFSSLSPPIWRGE